MKNILLLSIGLLVGVAATYMWMSRKGNRPDPKPGTTITEKQLLKSSNNFIEWVMMRKDDSLKNGKVKMDTVYRGCMVSKATLEKLAAYDACYLVFGMNRNSNKISLFAEPLYMAMTGNVATTATGDETTTTTTTNTTYSGTGEYIECAMPMSFCPYICPTVLNNSTIYYSPTLSN